MIRKYNIPAPQQLTVVYQFYVYEHYRQCVKTYVRKNVKYGTALHIYKKNKNNKSFISWRVFDSAGYEFIHYERYFSTNFFIGSYIPHDYRKFLREEGFEHYEV